MPKGTADYDIKLVRTRGGGLGILITEFGKEEARYKGKGRKEIIKTAELTMYAQKNDPERDQGIQDQTGRVEPNLIHEVSGRLSSQKEKDSGRASAAAQSTPLFIGTRHKELRALLQSRDDPDRWAASMRWSIQLLIGVKHIDHCDKIKMQSWLFS